MLLSVLVPLCELTPFFKQFTQKMTSHDISPALHPPVWLTTQQPILFSATGTTLYLSMQHIKF